MYIIVSLSFIFFTTASVDNKIMEFPKETLLLTLFISKFPFVLSPFFCISAQFTCIYCLFLTEE